MDDQNGQMDQEAHQVELPWQSLWTGDQRRGYVSSEEEASKVKEVFEIWSSLKFNVETGSLKPNPEMQRRLRFSDINDSVVVADGVPFVGNHQQTYSCMFGSDKHAKSKKKGQEENEEKLKKDHPMPKKRKYRLVQPSRKKGCSANIKMKQVVRYPDFKVSLDATHWKKSHISSQLRAALAKGEELNTEKRIYISLPDVNDHSGHEVGKLTGCVKPIDSCVSSKLTELVGQGVSNIKEMKGHLRIYVETILCPDLKPSPTDTAFYPSDKVLGTRMYAAKMKLGCPKMNGTRTQAKSWSNRMWQIVQRISSFVWDGEKKEIYLPFLVNGTQVGIIPPMMMETVASQPDVFEWRDDEIHLSPSLTTYDERTAMVAQFLEKCQQSGNFLTLNGWRNENYAVSRSYHNTPLLEMERSATCLFGIKQYGVHVNGYCRHPTDGMCMWIGKRSPTKQTYPGKLDQIAAGGLPAGLGIKECMMKESEEEANIPHHISSKAVSVGAISYFFEDERGLFPETQFIFDLELPLDFQPSVKDGEVSEFYFWPLSKVKEEIAGDDFKPNCSLICLDFLIRHGFITPDEEPHYIDFLSRLHQTHF